MKNLLRIFLLSVFLSLFLISSLKAAEFFFMDNELVGKPVPDFTLKTATGEKMNLTKFRDDKKTIIFFWATWCPHCRESLSDLSHKNDEFNTKNIRLTLVDLGESEKIVKRFLEKHKIVFNVFLDDEETLAEPYGIIGVPTFVFVNEKGIVKEVLHALPQDFEKVFED